MSALAGGESAETRPRYEPLETKSRPIFHLKITVSTASRSLHTLLSYTHNLLLIYNPPQTKKLIVSWFFLKKTGTGVKIAWPQCGQNRKERGGESLNECRSCCLLRRQSALVPAADAHVRSFVIEPSEVRVDLLRVFFFENVCVV